MRKSQQVAAQIRQKIIDGAEGYTLGSKLPIIKDLAVEYGVSTATFDLAVLELKTEGTLGGVQGGRLYVVGIPTVDSNGDDGPADAA